MHRDDSERLRQTSEERTSFLEAVGRQQEKQFDDLAELAAAVCWTPISQVNLLDEQQEYCKGAVGLQEQMTVQESSLCRETLRRGGEIFIVSDATMDPQFAGNPYATGKTALRFYAGVPVYSPAGDKVGVLSVVDTISRELKPWQIRSLRLVAQQVNARLELKMHRRIAEQALAENAATQEMFASFVRDLPFPCYVKDREHRLRFYNSRVAECYGISEQEWLGKTCHDLLPKDLADAMLQVEEETFARGKQAEGVFAMPNLRGSFDRWKLHYVPCQGVTGEAMLAVMMVAEETCVGLPQV